MDTLTWLGLESTHNPHRWFLPVTKGLCSGHLALFGGCGLGAAIEALERTSGRPLVWATAQYLAYAQLDEIMDIDVTIAASGYRTTQARLAVGHVGGQEILTVNGALGERPFPAFGTWAAMPEVEPPEFGPRRSHAMTGSGTLSDRLDQHWAVLAGEAATDEPQPLGPGRYGVWTRIHGNPLTSATALAVLGDFVPMGISFSVPRNVTSTSLDNTLRVVNVDPTEWYLLDIQIDALRNGFGHGTVHVWSETGTLLATASQSATVRERRRDGTGGSDAAAAAKADAHPGD